MYKISSLKCSSNLSSLSLVASPLGKEVGRPAEERLKKTGQHDFEVNEDGGRLDGDGGQGPSCGYDSQVDQDGGARIFFSPCV